jgi:hypothetical protein
MNHIVEEESGSFVPRHHHSHNGYYAGDFSAVPFTSLDVRFMLALMDRAA